jgi:hypothetical protein
MNPALRKNCWECERIAEGAQAGRTPERPFFTPLFRARLPQNPIFVQSRSFPVFPFLSDVTFINFSLWQRPSRLK